MRPYIIFLLPFIVTYFSMPIFRALAFKLKILDFPGNRKIHSLPTPLLGGVAIYLGLIIGLLFDPKVFYSFPPLILSATIIIIVGLIDDMRGLSAGLRLLFQLVASLIIVNSGMRIDFLPNLWWGNLLEVVITLIWLIGVTNAYNYIDGIDGLAAGSAIVNLFCFGVILYATHQNYLGALSVLLISACLGFLPYNFSKEKAFLGDAGSTLLGFIMASISVSGYWAEDNIVRISIPVLILGVPIFDMIFTTVMRIRGKKVKTVVEWLEYGGSDHFHHYLVDLGLGHIGSVLLIYSVTLFLGIGAIMVSNSNAVEALLALLQAFIIFVVIAILIVAGKRQGEKIRNT